MRSTTIHIGPEEIAAIVLPDSFTPEQVAALAALRADYEVSRDSHIEAARLRFVRYVTQTQRGAQLAHRTISPDPEWRF